MHGLGEALLCLAAAGLGLWIHFNLIAYAVAKGMRLASQASKPAPPSAGLSPEPNYVLLSIGVFVALFLGFLLLTRGCVN